MSKRADRQVRYEARDGARLRFVVDCLSDAELRRIGLIDPREDRPAQSVLLKRIDGKMQVFERADRRLRRGAGSEFEIDPQWCKCADCAHEWIGYFLPQSASVLAKVMGRLQCPECRSGPSRIKPIDAPSPLQGRSFVSTVLDELGQLDAKKIASVR